MRVNSERAAAAPPSMFYFLMCGETGQPRKKPEGTGGLWGLGNEQLFHWLDSRQVGPDHWVIAVTWKEAEC